MKKAVDDFRVIENQPLNATNHLIRLRSPVPLPEIYPGQFVNVRINHTDEVFLRRPFSVFDIDYKAQTLSLIVKILGKGSTILSRARSSEEISLIYPLGKGFTLPGRKDRILLVGGGSGIAPLMFLAKTAGLPVDQTDIILGFRNVEDSIELKEYTKYGSIHRTTEDGSRGVKGRATEHPLISRDLGLFDKIYACGPLPMMKAVGIAAKKKKIFCEVSLENEMACGYGTCLCCIEPTTKGNLRVCTDGPVFNMNLLQW